MRPQWLQRCSSNSPRRQPSQNARLTSLMVGRIGSAFGLSLMSMPQDQAARGVERHAAAGDEAELGVRDLALAAFAAHLPHALDDVQPALHVGLRQVAAGGIDRKLATQRDALTARNELAALAFAAEAG